MTNQSRLGSLEETAAEEKSVIYRGGTPCCSSGQYEKTVVLFF